MEEAERICGLDRVLLERFLTLFRDRYPLADKANLFLELETGTSGINIAISNQRDAMSHLVMALTHPEWSAEQKTAQLISAEEHLRRAAWEPYEKTVSLTLRRVLELSDEYRQKVLSMRNYQSLAADGPSLEELRRELLAINELRKEGRQLRAHFTWDDTWEKAIEVFLRAFERAKHLRERLEASLAAVEQHDAAQALTAAAVRLRSRVYWTGLGAAIGLLLGWLVRSIW